MRRSARIQSLLRTRSKHLSHLFFSKRGGLTQHCLCASIASRGTFHWVATLLEGGKATFCRFENQKTFVTCDVFFVALICFVAFSPCVSKQCPADGVWRIGRGGSPDRVLKTRLIPSESSAGHGLPPQRVPKQCPANGVRRVL